MSLKIRKFGTAETARLVRDVCHPHPEWVHEQLGAVGESDIQAILDQVSEDEFRNHPGSEDDCGIYWAAEA